RVEAGEAVGQELQEHVLNDVPGLLRQDVPAVEPAGQVRLGAGGAQFFERLLHPALFGRQSQTLVARIGPDFCPRQAGLGPPGAARPGPAGGAAALPAGGPGRRAPPRSLSQGPPPSAIAIRPGPCGSSRVRFWATYNHPQQAGTRFPGPFSQIPEKIRPRSRAGTQSLSRGGTGSTPSPSSFSVAA